MHWRLSSTQFFVNIRIELIKFRFLCIRFLLFCLALLASKLSFSLSELINCTQNYWIKKCHTMMNSFSALYIFFFRFCHLYYSVVDFSNTYTYTHTHTNVYRLCIAAINIDISKNISNITNASSVFVSEHSIFVVS